MKERQNNETQKQKKWKIKKGSNIHCKKKVDKHDYSDIMRRRRRRREDNEEDRGRGGCIGRKEGEEK